MSVRGQDAIWPGDSRQKSVTHSTRNSIGWIVENIGMTALMVCALFKCNKRFNASSDF
jgi:hypothetical protein